jgi:hypothetical protein
MTRVNIIFIPTPPEASYIIVGMYLVFISVQPNKCVELGPASRRSFGMYLLLTVIKF